MPIPAKVAYPFRWTGVDASGGTCSGVVYASSKRSARVLLYGRGIRTSKLRRKHYNISTERGVPTEALVHFMYQLTTVVECGVSISPALDILVHTTQHRGLRALIDKIRQHLENGISLGKALENYPHIFDPTVRALISTGEYGGTFSFMLRRATEHVQHAGALRRQMRQALFYPTLIGILAVLVSIFLIFKVVPAFAQSFATFNAELPTLTRRTIAIAESIQRHWPILLTTLTLLPSTLYYLRHTTVLRHISAYCGRHLPIISTLLLEKRMAQFCAVAASTLEAKIPVAQALQLAGAASGDPILTRETLVGAQTLSGAPALHEWVAHSKQFPPLLVQMVYVGESTGRLVEVLRFLATHYEQQIKYRTQRLSALLEPLLITILGLFIGVLILAMYLPIFELGNIL